MHVGVMLPSAASLAQIMVIHFGFKRKKPTTRPSLATHIRVSPYDATSEPDDGFFMLVAIFDHAPEKSLKFRPLLFNCIYSILQKTKQDSLWGTLYDKIGHTAYNEAIEYACGEISNN